MKLRFTLAVIKAYHSSADGSAFFVGLLCNSSVKLLIFVTVDGICALLDNLIYRICTWPFRLFDKDLSSLCLDGSTINIKLLFHDFAKVLQWCIYNYDFQVLRSRHWCKYMLMQ